MIKRKLQFILLFLALIGGGYFTTQKIKPVYADTGIYDWIYYNWTTGLAYFNNNVDQWLFGGTATTTDAVLEVQGGLATDNFNFTYSTGTDMYINGDVKFDSMNGLDATYSSVNDWFKLLTSAGRITGGALTDNGSQTVAISAGTGLLRIANDDISQLKFIDWTASTTGAIANSDAKYYGVEYNSGSPRVVAKDANTWDYDTEFPLGSVINQAGSLYFTNNPFQSGDQITNINEWMQSRGYIVKDEYVGGLVVSVTGTRNPAMTSGQLWSRGTESSITAKDCSGTDTFYAWWRDGAGGWTRADTASSTYDVIAYDNNTGSPIAMNNNWFANYWVWTTYESPGELMLIYPQNQYSNSATAEAESIPLFPTEWYESGILLAQILFQEGTDAPVEVIDLLSDTTKTAAQAADHANLSDLAWTVSNHTGTASTFAGFDGTGAATEYTESNYLLTNGTRALGGAWDLGSYALTNINIDSGTAYMSIATTTDNIYIPIDASCSTAVAGEMCIDTTSDQFKFFGGSERVLNFRDEKCFTVESITTDDDDVPIWSPNNNITITDIYCRTEGGTSASIFLSDGTNAMDTIVCDADGQADDGTIANNTVSANERLEFDTTAVSGEVTWVNYCFTYTIDAD